MRNESDCLSFALKPIDNEEDPFLRAKARAMVLCYVALWNLSKYKVLAVEKKFSFPLIDVTTGQPSKHWTVSGKIDVILQDERNDVRLVEHKTTSDEAQPGGGYRLRLNNDSQISQYFLGVESLGYNAVDLIYDVLLKPKQKPLQATPVEKQIRVKKTGALRKDQRERDETPEEYEQRVIGEMSENPEQHIVRIDCSRSPEAKQHYHLNIWKWSERMRHDAEVGHHPQNEDHCWKYNTPCEFWEVCTGVTSIENPMRYRDATSTHEELEEENV